MNLEHLKNTLNNARPFLMNQEYLPILTHFAFTGHSVIAYNDVQAIELTLNSELECAVPGVMLTKLLNTMDGTDIEIVQKGKKVEIGQGRNKTKLACLPKTDFVFSMPLINESKIVKLPFEILDGIRRCLISVIDNPAHPELNGITLFLTYNAVTLYSSDNKTVSRFKIEETVTLPPGTLSIEAAIPATFCEQLVALAKTYKKDENPIEFIFEDSHILARYPSCLLFTRLLTTDNIQDFPTIVKRFLPNEDALAKDALPSALYPAINRATLLAEDKVNQSVTHVTVSNNEVQFVTEGRYGRSQDTIDFETDFGEFVYSIDPTLLERVLKVTDKIAFQPKLTIVEGYFGQFTHLISHLR